MIRAAGVLFLAGDRVLLVRRTDEGDASGAWAFPGGKLEDGEKADEAARRECEEEIGRAPKSGLSLFARRIKDGVDFTTYTCDVPSAFTPKLNGEHDAYMWAKIGDPYPEPLHPGAKIALGKLRMDELQIAQLMAAGELTSPTMYENIALFAMRITGTGVAYRSIGGGEYVYRKPEVYLNDQFLARCAGLPVIMEHPDSNRLDSEEFADRTVGTILLPYLNHSDAEVWGIAKIYDAAAIEMMCNLQLSTSPSVVFRNPRVDNITKKLENGKTFLIEGKPSLLDHLAICEIGVWDKGGEPAGVRSTTQQLESSKMATDETRTVDKDLPVTEADKVRKDDFGDSSPPAAAGAPPADEGFDQLMAVLEKINSRLDALEGAKEPAPEAAPAPAPAPAVARGDADMSKDGAHDGGKEIDMTKETVASTPEAVKADADEKAEFDKWKADRAKADAQDCTDPKMQALTKADSAIVKRLDNLERRTVERPDDDFAAMSDAQARADQVSAAFGDSTPRFMNGERLMDYRRRLAKRFQKHSADWKGIDLALLPASALDIAERAIYADAMKVALNPVSAPEGQLREIKRRDSTGREISTFVGVPSAWMNEFRSPKRYLRKISKEG